MSQAHNPGSGSGAHNMGMIDHVGNYGQKNEPLILGLNDGDRLLDDNDDDDDFEIEEGRQSI